MMPSRSQIEIPLLQALVQFGGEARLADLYPLVTAAFPELTDDEKKETVSSGANKWTNRIQWVRASLEDKGQLVNRDRGVWAITSRHHCQPEQEGPGAR